MHWMILIMNSLMLGNFSSFYCHLLTCFNCHQLTCFKINFFKKFFQLHYQSVKRLDPDQDQQNVGPDLGPNCLEKLSADIKSHP